MKNSNGFLKLMILLLAAVLCFAALSINVGADFGGFGGDADYGGGGGGGGGGGSVDWGDSGSDWGDGGDALFITDDPAVFGVIVVVLIVFWLFIKFGSKKKHTPSVSGGGATPTDQSTLKPISEFLEADPEFAEAAFTEKLSNLYVQMQQCWQGKDIEPLRPHMTDMLYNQMDSQLQSLVRLGRTNYVDRIAVLQVRLMGWKQDDVNDIMIARLSTRIVDYTVDDKTGNLVSGDNTVEKFMEYEWTLVRSKGAHTPDADGTTAFHCPSCGAPMNVNQSAKCEYCGTVLTTSEYDWVVSQIKGISQRTAN